MNNFFQYVKQNCISGVLFLLPVLVLFILIQKVFGYSPKFGYGIPKIMALDQLFGKNAANFFCFIILMVFVYGCGYLVWLSFFPHLFLPFALDEHNPHKRHF